MGTSKILIDGVGIDLTQDTVAANKMLSGTKAHDSNGDSVTGNIPSKAAQTYTPGTSTQTISAGQYLSGTQTIQGDADLVASNIKSGVNIFGVTGTYEGGGGGEPYDGTVENYGMLPTKGEIITMDLGAPTPYAGIANQYRVISVNGNIAEVVAMYDAAQIAFGSDHTKTYAGNELDNYLNNTWYNALSAEAKAAIVSKTITQYLYTPNEGTYDASSHASYADYSTKSVYGNVGERYVYALDVEDIEQYFGGTDSEEGAYGDSDIFTLFWNVPSRPANYTYPWLRSADSLGNNAYYVRGYNGVINRQATNSTDRSARPAFCVDCTKIQWIEV